MTHQMPNYLRQLRPVSSHEMYAANRLGRGMYTQCQTTAGESVRLTLRRSLSTPSSEGWISIRTGIGIIHLESEYAESLLNLFSSAHFVSPEQSKPEEEAWYTALYNHHLYPDFRHLFAKIEPVSSQPESVAQYELVWQQGVNTGTIQLNLDERTLEQLLDRVVWQPCSTLDLSELRFTTSVSLGQLQLTKKTLRQLSSGDVLIPTTPHFSVTGEGSLTIASRNLQLRYHSQGTQPAYLVTHLEKAHPEDTTMYDEYAQTDHTFPEENESYSAEMYAGENYADDDDSRESEISGYQREEVTVAGNTADLSDTPVTLKLQAGQITMSLKELSQIHVGSVLVATGEAAGHATLYHGHHPIARGELVEVEGRLGIQLTSVSLTSQSASSSQSTLSSQRTLPSQNAQPIQEG
ncbi:FliM/FliN family flagellar motor switch protein [Vibrio mangrovi]|uniref:FliM/FliN family flagellar motor switch protein n=1 Tax=Vibrio mangrovi TaxID=474394 RepID=A0A1Y6IXS2_9VIBR|nr:FliM/FliN family flagellar motor switch protein [Vibrio mangrovi]MDW6001967.1 FliM/FliN family flagellar motor switch protein [Vibrio mangrovi]SMS02485.1 Type III secretion protein HrcQb [Vibrio mangrovi]